MTILSDDFATSSEGRKNTYARRRQMSALSLKSSTVSEGFSLFTGVTDEGAASEPLRHEVPEHMAYLRRVLFAMAADESSGLNYKTVNHYLALLGRLMGPDSVYPAITPDGVGGISFEWSAKGWLVELDLDIDGSFYLMQTTDGSSAAPIAISGKVSRISIESVKVMIDEFSEFVYAHNMNWRSNFA